MQGVVEQLPFFYFTGSIWLWKLFCRSFQTLSKVGEISLLELQMRSKLSLVDLWLGLLLGDTGCSIERSGTGGDEDFYWGGGILVLGTDR
jgi:hypothetical protein